MNTFNLPGFSLAGEYRLAGDRLTLIGDLPTEAGVYALVPHNRTTALYIGKARNLRQRHNGYRCGRRNQKAHSIGERLRDALRSGARIQVWIATPKDTTWRGLPVGSYVGLEHGLIDLLQPAWNNLGNKSPDAAMAARRTAAARLAHMNRRAA
jgi:hypothetical protein